MSQKSNRKYKKRSMPKEIWRRLKKNKAAMVGLIIISILIIVTIFADLIADYDTLAISQNVLDRLQHPSSKHWFGTDGYGRDVFARIVHGTRVSLLLGVAAVAISLFFGTIIGALAGFYGGKVDNVIMRIMDTIQSIPTILLALAIVAALGPGIRNLFVAITVTSTPGFARVIRSVILPIIGQEFIEAARAYGTKDRRIIFKYIIPNAIGPILVQATMAVSGMIIATASLSFIGMGIQPPRPEWGSMLAEAREYIRSETYLVIFPGLAIVLAALSLNLLGDGLRDALDPRLKN